MLLSMTGFGRATGQFQDKNFSVEIRSLNSKMTDIRFKIPQQYREFEPHLRKLILKRAERGKLELNIDVQSHNGDDGVALNHDLFKRYFKELSTLQSELGFSSGDFAQAILRIPNVVATGMASIPEEEYQALEQIISDALDRFQHFRTAEGEAMEKDCRLRIANIQELMNSLDPFEEERVDRLRNRINQHMEEYVGKDNIDANRFEQEILYYLEKIDITEEKVRLAQHCKYFIEVVDQKKTAKGRKLNFIVQEMGREINTLGSKANSSKIQHKVVQMKDELEKIKEQVANAL